MKAIQLWMILLSLAVFSACAPKITEPVATTTQPETPAPSPEDENLSPCPKFSDAPNPDEVETNYVLYRDFLRVEDYEKAYDLWKKVYEVAPAADGQRNTVLADGIRFNERFIRETADTSQWEPYIDEIFALYDQVAECYPEGGYVQARKAFDLYYKYPWRATKEEVFELFKESIEIDGEDVQDFVVNPFTALLVDLYFADKISMAEAQKYAAMITDLVKKGVENCEGVMCERWTIIEGYAPVRLEAFETVKGFYDCDYYTEKYYNQFVENPADCDVIRTVYSRMFWGGCDETNEKLKELIRVGNEKCVEPGVTEVAYDALREGEYDKAIELFEKAADEEEAVEKKARYLLTVAKIYYAHKRNFSKARQYARQVSQVRPDWGEPYLLIGQLYASSGPLCGPGTGWDSQIVVWPALDMWNQAKRVDPSATEEANKWIGRYAKYMPKKEDVFLRGLQAGQSFRVGCWIQETTTIRTAD
jgi:tetratricopeptide (TPR) repeat protein